MPPVNAPHPPTGGVLTPGPQKAPPIAAPKALTALAPAPTDVLPPLLPAKPPSPYGSSLSLDAHELLINIQDLEELGSHTQLPLTAPALYGNWAVSGPAVVRRVGGALRALVRSGGWVSLGAALDTVLSADEASLGSYDRDGAPVAATAFELHGTHVELSGPFKLLLPGPGTRVHDGHLILTVPELREDNCILLLPGSCLSHPLCAMPVQRCGTLLQPLLRGGARRGRAGG